MTALLEPDPVQDADDLDAEDRWPEFATAAAHQTPVRSVLAYRLAFTPNSVRDTADVAGHATIALAGPGTGQVVDLWAASRAVYAVGRRAATRAIGDSPAYRTTSRVR